MINLTLQKISIREIIIHFFKKEIYHKIHATQYNKNHRQ